jgi:hypothetical protein
VARLDVGRFLAFQFAPRKKSVVVQFEEETIQIPSKFEIENLKWRTTQKSHALHRHTGLAMVTERRSSLFIP